MSDDLEVPLTNREKKRKPKSNSFWCWGCDAKIISSGEKCWYCGTADISNQARKRDIKVYE